MTDLTLKAENIHWLDRLCRKALFSRLENLHTGCLRLQEGDQEYVFGDENSQEFNVSITIHDSEAYRSIALNGSVGAGESYMTGDWSSDNLPLLVRLLSRNKDVVDSIDSGLANIGKIFS